MAKFNINSLIKKKFIIQSIIKKLGWIIAIKTIKFKHGEQICKNRKNKSTKFRDNWRWYLLKRVRFNWSESQS